MNGKALSPVAVWSIIGAVALVAIAGFVYALNSSTTFRSKASAPPPTIQSSASGPPPPPPGGFPTQ